MMQIAKLAVLLLVAVLAGAEGTACWANGGKKALDVPPYIMVTEGIVGGFVPPHVRQRIILWQLDGKFHLYVMKQPGRDKPVTHHVGMLDKEQSRQLIASVAKMGLWKLPVESPTGCQDIYGMDTSVAIFAENKFWRNGGPGGCVHKVSKVQPAKKQKATFRKVVALIKKSALQNAKVKGDAESFNAIVENVRLHGARAGKAAGGK